MSFSADFTFGNRRILFLGRDLYCFSSQVAIEKTHAAVVQIRQRSSALLMAKHYSPEQVMEIESNVTKRWEKLVTCAEDR